MAAQINIAAYSDALVVLGTAGIVVPLVKQLGISPVLGYLVAGAVLGPLGLGSFIADVPVLYWLTVVDAKNVAGIADLGVVFLLFLIGLELTVERLTAMRRLVFYLGGLQVVATTVVLALALLAIGIQGAAGLLIAACLALSSTAIVLEVLSKEERLTTSTGRTGFAILLAQDLAVIPLLIFVSILGAKGGGGPVWLTIATAVGQALVAAVAIIVVGRVTLRPLFRLVASTRSTELFIAATLFVIVATGVVAAQAGVSMALGAFLAGLLLAGTEYRKAIEATIEPFKGLLLGIFFFTIGMNIDPREIVNQPVMLTACVAGLIVIKAAIVCGLARAYGIGWPAAVETGLLLGPSGELALVAVALASASQTIEPQLASFVVAVTSLSMLTIPFMPRLAERLAPVREAPLDAELLARPESRQQHAIVIGYGRVGRVVCELLDRNNVAYTAVDMNPATVTSERRRGRSIYYGDATSQQFLDACGLSQAAAVVVTIHTKSEIDMIVAVVRAARPEIPIIARAKDGEHARHLYQIGVSDAVPETIEASLQLSEAALVGLGRPSGPVIATIHEKRDEFRAELQAAAADAGASAGRGLRAKRT